MKSYEEWKKEYFQHKFLKEVIAIGDRWGVVERNKAAVSWRRIAREPATNE